MEYKKCNKLVNITQKKQTHIYRKQTSGYRWEAIGGGEGGVIIYDEWCQICDLWRKEFRSGARDKAWSLRAFV